MSDMAGLRHMRRMAAIDACLRAEGMFRVAEKHRTRPLLQRGAEMLEDTALQLIEVGLETRSHSLLGKANVLKLILHNMGPGESSA